MDHKLIGQGKILASATALVFGLSFGYDASAQHHQHQQSGSSTTPSNTYQSTPNTIKSQTNKSGSQNHTGSHSQMKSSSNQKTTGSIVSEDGATYEVYEGREMTGNCSVSDPSSSAYDNSHSFDKQNNLNNTNTQESAFANPEMYQNTNRFDDATYDVFDSAYDDFDDVYEGDDPNVMYDYDDDGIAEFAGENYGDVDENLTNDYDGNGVADYAYMNYAGQEGRFTFERDTLDQNIVFDVEIPNDSDLLNDSDVIGGTTPNVDRGSGTLSIAYGPFIAPLALSDAEILDIFITMNNGEIMTSRPAIDETAQDWVRDYAQKMVTMHTDVVKRAQDLSVEPAQNLISSTLETNAQGVSTRLTALDGRELDNQYITSQLAMHQNALDMLDNTLIPLAQSQELKNLLTEARSHVANHLAEVQKLYHKLD